MLPDGVPWGGGAVPGSGIAYEMMKFNFAQQLPVIIEVE
jgi:hypothetical protein